MDDTQASYLAKSSQECTKESIAGMEGSITSLSKDSDEVDSGVLPEHALENAASQVGQTLPTSSFATRPDFWTFMTTNHHGESYTSGDRPNVALTRIYSALTLFPDDTSQEQPMSCHRVSDYGSDL